MNANAEYDHLCRRRDYVAREADALELAGEVDEAKIYRATLPKLQWLIDRVRLDIIGAK